jgi:hypothetical protein
MTGLPLGVVFAVNEIVRVVVADQDHVASPPAIAAVGSAPRLEFFAAEAGATAPAVPSLYLDDTFVDKHARYCAQSPGVANPRLTPLRAEPYLALFRP